MSRLTENKYFFWGFTGFVAMFFAWAGWVTDNIYGQQRADASQIEKINQACKNAEEIKTDIKEHKANQEKKTDEILDLLKQIQIEQAKQNAIQNNRQNNKKK